MWLDINVTLYTYAKGWAHSSQFLMFTEEDGGTTDGEETVPND